MKTRYLIGIFLAFALGLSTLGCASGITLPVAMPAYDSVQADKHYVDISAMDERQSQLTYVLMMLIQMDVDLTPQKDAINAETDKFLYHRAQATVLLFHGRYEAMDAEIKLGMDAMDAIEQMLMAKVENIKGDKI